jgi:hypothetical protein
MGALRQLCRRDPRWRSFDLLELDRSWDRVPLSPKVPEGIALRVELAKDLCRYSYFKQGFADTAFLYILIAYEAALREVFPKHAKTEDLELLINSADRAGLIPDRQPAWKVHALRHMRNGYMHGSVYSDGIFGQEHVLRVIDLINCVFDEEARVVNPPLYVPRLLAAKRRKNFMDGFSSAPRDRLKPGDSMVFVGTEDSYPPGTYTCLECGKVLHIAVECRQLPLCRSKKCKSGGYKFTPEVAATQ